ncbi:MAG: flagellar basal body-associated FliL family protein [Actinomycetota bacterium]|nr:flagellar basal body-associated FliL family protein [Actinomycetota bacterium]
MSVTTLAKKNGTDAEAAAPKSKKMLIIIIIAAVLVLGGGGAFYFLVMKKGPTTVPKDVAGIVVPLDAIQINLSGEHYLRVGISLQMTSTAGAEADGGKALDATIGVFSGQTVADVNDVKVRAKLKAELLKRVRELYEKTVMDIYFTQFVTQ